MKIAILSGKGGTGKTLVSVNLAAAASKAQYIDCDVEEPNGHLFFKPEQTTTEEVFVKIPYVDEELCNGCRTCVEFCKFNALAYIQDKWMLFEEVCHSCGGCTLLCPQKALKEKDKVVGKVVTGVSKGVQVSGGFLNPGEASGIPIIKKLLDGSSVDAEFTFVDCPPGSACIVMESIKDADYCILVAEPTLFGVHNFSMVYELVKVFQKPYGAILNKCLDSENPAEKLCVENNINILGKIPFDKELGALNSNGKIVVRESEKYEKIFKEILELVAKEVHL